MRESLNLAVFSFEAMTGVLPVGHNRHPGSAEWSGFGLNSRYGEPSDQTPTQERTAVR
jgi:hypothetical protein